MEAGAPKKNCPRIRDWPWHQPAGAFRLHGAPRHQRRHSVRKPRPMHVQKNNRQEKTHGAPNTIPTSPGPHDTHACTAREFVTGRGTNQREPFAYTELLGIKGGTRSANLAPCTCIKIIGKKTHGAPDTIPTGPGPHYKHACTHACTRVLPAVYSPSCLRIARKYKARVGLRKHVVGRVRIF